MGRKHRQPAPGPGFYVPAEIIELPNTLLKPGDPIPPPIEFITRERQVPSGEEKTPSGDMKLPE